MNKRNKTQNRDLYIKIRVNQAEIDLIKRKFHKSGMQTFSEFIRTMILEGYIVKIDESKFQKISIRLQHFFTVQASFIVNGVNQLWQPLIFYNRRF